MTINALFQESAATHGARPALRYKEDKVFKDISYSDLAKRVEEFASGLTALGVTKGDRVALLSENRPEWAITDLATLAIGGVVVPLYPSLPSAQIAFIVRNSGAKALVVSDSKQLKKAMEAPRLMARSFHQPAAATFKSRHVSESMRDRSRRAREPGIVSTLTWPLTGRNFPLFLPEHRTHFSRPML